MAQSEIITRMKKRQLKRKAFSFSKYLIVIGIIVYGGYLYKGEKSFLDIKNDILSYFPKDNRDRINVKQVKATLTSISKTNDNSNRRKKISSENQKKDNFADKNKEIDLKIKTKIKEKTANINKEENKTLSTVIVKNETENIVDDYKNSILPHDFQYGKENEVLDYSWNIDIEPYEISNKLRTYRNKNRENKSPEWEYMTDNLSYYTKNISQIKPDYSIPNISYVYIEWNYNINISQEKILVGLLNGKPYK